MKISKEDIAKLNRKYKSKVIEIRRHLHRHPELSFEEYQTSKFIQNVLSEYQIEHTAGWADTGIVATIGKGHKTIALRADIDALPIQEKSQNSYASINEGIMHACGHDAHTSSLLGTCFILKELEPSLDKTFKIIFQPGEEKLPGGASLLIKEGVLHDPDVAIIFGQHVHPELECGKVGFCPGPFMASTDEIYITVEGKGGHAAMPEKCVDPIFISSQIINALHQLSNRYATTQSTVLTIGKIQSEGGATNVIPDRVHLQGTFRAFDEEWRTHAHNLIRDIPEGIAKSYKGSCKVDVIKGYPYLHNDIQLTENTITNAKEYMGDDHVKILPQRMTGEDFGFYSQKVPACFYRIGIANSEKNITSGVHTDTFDVDEDVFGHSSGLMAWLALKC